MFQNLISIPQIIFGVIFYFEKVETNRRKMKYFYKYVYSDFVLSSDIQNHFQKFATLPTGHPLYCNDFRQGLELKAVIKDDNSEPNRG